MAIIQCGECGRAISNKAGACIGCGAPVNAPAGFDLTPKRSIGRPLTRRQLKRRALLSASLLALGVLAAGALGHRTAGNRLAATIAALLLICGLCACVVTLLQSVASRR